MPIPAKIRILLADEDALRRDGLAAVLSGQPEMEVVGSSADGEAALVQIRSLHPDIAVVDLNLPKVHGIELVRRIRAESLGTRVIVVASTPDDEIVREVVRAGGDGYLLKNGPARHLIDAISYIRDGGQYFSPQLQRDGRDRHLLVEPARTPAQPHAAEPVASEADTRAAKEERARRRGARLKNDSASLRQRIREAAPQSNMDDRDYEIMSRMADGIRPILDRLDEIDSRVASMEDGASPVPADPRG
jgi:DNA-binding NarL/FixJ family response regulator